MLTKISQYKRLESNFMKKLVHFVIIGAIVLFTHSSHADSDVAKSVIDKAIEGGFTELEKQIIDKYYKNANKENPVNKKRDTKKNKKKDLPPGLAKKESLPPGLAMQLERNGTLPPGIAKRNLPADLENELPDPAKGLERIIVDNAIVLVEKVTGRVVDILKDVVTGT
jgi:Ni/Co efflux regulator RcnB